MKRMMLLAAFLFCGTLSAEDAKPLDRAELDKRAGKTAFDAVKLGTDLWADGEVEGCFRLYQGTLMALQPMLDHHPKLAALVKEKLDAAKDQRADKGAFTLREALDAVQKQTAGTDTAANKKASLWSRLGGEKAIKAVMHDMIEAALKDPKVNFTRDGSYKLDAKKQADLEDRLVELVSEFGKGPLEYTGRDVKKLHAGMKISGDEFDAMVACLEASLKKNKVPEAAADELLFAVKSIKTYFSGQ
jgi:hemoglobin